MATLFLLRLILFASIVVCVPSQRLGLQKSWEEKHFNFTNCNTTAVPLFVKFLEVSPDPILFGEAIYVKLKLDLERDVGVDQNRIEFGLCHIFEETRVFWIPSPFAISLTFTKNYKVDFSLRLKTSKGYTELCDFIGEEACHYNDFCTALKQYMEDKTCPSFIPKKFHNNCSCPCLKGEYNFPFPPVKLPKLPFGLRGTFDMTLNLHEQGKYLGCIEFHFCVTNCKPLGTERINTGTQRILSIP